MSQAIPKDISTFIKAQTCVTICCLEESNTPYCFTCFFAYDEALKCLYFKSQMNTHHAALLEKNGKVAGTLLEDNLNKLAIKGIQFRALVQRNSVFDINASVKYHALYPIAVGIPGDMWTVYLQEIKFTDNSQGFGHKTIWELDAE